MGSRNISIRDEAYDLLKSLQLEGESFSDTIIRISRKFSNLHTFIGKGTLTDEEYEEELSRIVIERNEFDKERKYEAT